MITIFLVYHSLLVVYFLKISKNIKYIVIIKGEFIASTSIDSTVNLIMLFYYLLKK